MSGVHNLQVEAGSRCLLPSISSLRSDTGNKFVYSTKHSSLRVGMPTKHLSKCGHLPFRDTCWQIPSYMPTWKTNLGDMKHCLVQSEAEDWVRGFDLVKECSIFTFSLFLHTFLMSHEPRQGPRVFPNIVLQEVTISQVELVFIWHLFLLKCIFNW